MGSTPLSFQMREENLERRRAQLITQHRLEELNRISNEHRSMEVAFICINEESTLARGIYRVDTEYGRRHEECETDYNRFDASDVSDIFDADDAMARMGFVMARPNEHSDRTIDERDRMDIESEGGDEEA